MRTLLAPVVLIAALLALAGCGASTSSKSNTGGRSATVDVGKSKLGEILVDKKGRTLYLFESDKRDKSTCTGSCAATWLPLAAPTPSAPSAGNSVDGGALGTTTRSDGTQQVTYHGHPLYRYAGDGNTVGSMKGEGLKTFGGEWYVVDASGKAVEPQSKSEMGGGGSGYGY